MRKVKVFLSIILRKPILFLASKFSSRPVKELVHQSLSTLYKSILSTPGKNGIVINFSDKDKFIIFSDQHKGTKNGADLFATAERNYLAALDYYYENNFRFINLGDCEELWGNSIDSVRRNNLPAFDKEKKFVFRDSYVKIFGNHDLYWDNSPLAGIALQEVFGQRFKVYEGAVLQIEHGQRTFRIFLTHGHQGDLQSDGNWFSKWFVSNIWAPLQMYMHINSNTPSVNDTLKSLHNEFMYDWSIQQTDLLLITGHTHQPVFKSLTHLEKLYKDLNGLDKSDEENIKILQAQIQGLIRKGAAAPNFNFYKPAYFNTGCCCFDDGDITGIEIEDGYIRLIKWEYEKDTTSVRKILDEACLIDLFSSP